MHFRVRSEASHLGKDGQRHARWPTQRVFALLCVLLIGIFGRAHASSSQPSPSPADSTEAARYLIRGTTEAQLGDHEEAISFFEAALERLPGEPAVLLALADAHEAQGDLATALFYARQAQKPAGSSRPHTFRRLAELQRAAGEPAAALQTYTQLLDHFPDQHTAQRQRARLQKELGRADAALTAYEAYLKHTRRPPVSVYREMLSLYTETGDTTGLEETLRTLVERRPNTPTYRRRLGTLYADDGRPETALQLLAPLARQRPDDAPLRRRVTQLARQTGTPWPDTADAAQPDSIRSKQATVEALVQRARSIYDSTTGSPRPDSSRLRRADDLLRRALDRAPAHETALALRARLSQERGRFELAGRLLEQLLEITPRDPERWTRAAVAHQRAHQYPAAASVAEEGLLLFPGHVPLARTAAFARLRGDAPAQAAEHFHTALRLLDDASSTDHGEALLRAGLGLSYTRLDRPKEAGRAFKIAASLAPDHPEVLRLRAQAQAEQGDQLDLALDLAQRAAEQSPNTPRVLHTLGWVHLQRDELDLARRHLRAALDAGTPSPQLLEHLGDVNHALGNDAAAQTYWKQAADPASERPSRQERVGSSPNP